MSLDIEWTDDCQGKKDYDGDLLSISTRYYPRGGGVDVYTVGKGWSRNEDQSIKATAHCSFYLHGRHAPLIDKNFEGWTFEEVATQVEVWAEEQYEKAATALRLAFGNDDE